MTRNTFYRVVPKVCSVILLSMATAGLPGNVGAEEGVTVTVEVEGDTVPSGTVTATATVDIIDGSMFESILWTQVGGVEAVIGGADTEKVTATLGPVDEYKAELMRVLSEPRVDRGRMPPNVAAAPGDPAGGLQNRWQVVGVNPFALATAGRVSLEIEVVTTSGTTRHEVEISTGIPWRVAPGVHAVPLGRPVLLYGKDQEVYDWVMEVPVDSVSTLADAATRAPDFTPDVAGQYTVEVTDTTDITKGPVTLRIFAGTWAGVIFDEDEGGRPVANPICLGCHGGSPAPDKFTPWVETGHSRIFSDNLNERADWGPQCFDCHAVGHDPDGENAGIDETADFDDFLDAGLVGNPDPDNWRRVLDDFRQTARLANVQCESCHGPQDTLAHTNGEPRISLSAAVCAQCHGEAVGHGRFQQWQLSPHSNYSRAVDEGGDPDCSRCHTANGFLAWVPVLRGDADGDPLDELEVTWGTDEVHPQTCQTCHDPHSTGTRSGRDTDAVVRISDDTPPLLAGFTATDVGKGAVCMTCHNTRRGLRNDGAFESYIGTPETARAPHAGSQADVLMGQNAYMVDVGTRGFHSRLEDSCVDCHMEATPPSPELAYSKSGTNHTFRVRTDICAQCHTVATAEEVQGRTEEDMSVLRSLIEDGLIRLIGEQIAAGRYIDLGGEAAISNPSQITDLEFGGAGDYQAITVHLGGKTVVGPVPINDIDVVPPIGDSFPIYDVADRGLIKAGWNWNLIHNDGSAGVHNPAFVGEILKRSNQTMERLAMNGAHDGSGGGGIDGGLAGAVDCATPYVYWAEIAAHNQGADNSTWRTDISVRNTATSAAELEFVLHLNGGGRVRMDSDVDGASQTSFEDIVGMMGVDDGKGSLEICSAKSLQIVARTFNIGPDGTVGQFYDGHIGGAGLATSQSGRLIGLRQMTDSFRTNISVTNTGTDAAEVRITLHSADGGVLHAYYLTVGPGRVVQDSQPFKRRAGEADVGWGFALIEVTDGYGVHASASVIDVRTNDATTIPLKR